MIVRDDALTRIIELARWAPHQGEFSRQIRWAATMAEPIGRLYRLTFFTPAQLSAGNTLWSLVEAVDKRLLNKPAINPDDLCGRAVVVRLECAITRRGVMFRPVRFSPSGIVVPLARKAI
jgi:hypothetical protein